MPRVRLPRIAASCCYLTLMLDTRPLILLLEDDQPSAEALQLLLRDWGAEVVHGLNATDVRAAAGDCAGDATMIITDYHLGEHVNGVSLARELLEHAPGARVLVLSGSQSGAARRAAADAGYAFLQKPAPVNDIIAWLEHA